METCTHVLTHKKIDTKTCGTPVYAGRGSSTVRLQTTDNMAVDDQGLVHGGFIFSLADHAAMVAVNHPNVVLGSAEVRFLKPVKTGALLHAEAIVEVEEGKKKTVIVEVLNGEEKIFSGKFICFVLPKHVLE